MGNQIQEIVVEVQVTTKAGNNLTHKYSKLVIVSIYHTTSSHILYSLVWVKVLSSHIPIPLPFLLKMS